MKKLNIESLFPLTALLVLIFILSMQFFGIPPIGKVLDPFIGVVQNEDDESLNTSRFTDKMGLTDSVKVFFDLRKVPHIYAKNDEDLYFTQGYVTASLRLWQMDVLSYVSAGRLSEIFSDGLLNYDRNQRRIGILDAAKASLKMMEKDPETNADISAYTKGVNAYIRQLSYRKLPLEYKFLDYTPEPWSNLKTVLVMKNMANLLSGYDDDLNMTNLMLALGENKFNKYFPNFHVQGTPVVNDPVSKSNPDLAYTKKPDYLDYSFLSSGSVISAYNPKLGSNSWAVSGKKTKSGSPILCSDPHLNLSLPAIWIEMQLSAPGMNVYGVSIPGTPAVIIGFNENIAWGLTNGADDVKDWYKLKITDDYKKYELDGKWLDLNFTIEEIRRRGQAAFYDTIYHTIHGPIVSTGSFPGSQPGLINHALKWELANPSNEFLTFIKLNKAKNYEEYKEAIKHYSCPVQNFVFACKNNDIAVSHQGNMAVKRPGQGKFILDGTKRSHLYTKYIPEDSLPHLINPSCNYVLSANQQPTTANYAYYYNGNYVENRANRIRQLLDKENGFDVQKMEAMQLDNVNRFAVDALPVLIKSLGKAKLTEDQRRAVGQLGAWNGAYDLIDENAKLYELWWKNIKEYTWDEFKQYSFYSRLPDDAILLEMIRKEPDNEYFDRQATSMTEKASDIIGEAFIDAVTECDKLKKTGKIKWGDYNKVNLMHMSNIGFFSRMDIPSAGYPEAINAMSDKWGPSWRMIVELGDRPKAFGVYAGGQSGNIGSPYYDDFVDDWNKGKYYPLQFYMSITEAQKQATTVWIIR